jgi:D-alanine transaminase
MIYLNGQFISPEHAAIETTDRGFLLSDGIFETIPLYHGKPFSLEKHWARLKKSADLLELPIEFSYEHLEKTVDTLCKLNAIGGVRPLYD